MKNKRLISMLCVSAMAISMLIGCGKDSVELKNSEAQSVADSQEEASTEVKEEASTGDDEELEYVELNWYLSITEQPDKQMIQEALDEYFLEKLNQCHLDKSQG